VAAAGAMASTQHRLVESVTSLQDMAANGVTATGALSIYTSDPVAPHHTGMLIIKASQTQPC